MQEFIQLISYKQKLLKLYKKGEINNPSFLLFEDFLEYSLNSLGDIEEKMGLDIENITIEEEKQFVEKYLWKISIWVWVSYVTYWTDIDKLQSLRKTEIASKRSNWELIEYNMNIVTENINKALETEKKILAEYKDEGFLCEDNVYPVCVDNEINPILLRFVKKWKNIYDHELKDLVEEYVVRLNEALDFIFPGSCDIERDFEKSKENLKILDKYAHWKILELPLELKKFNYKWTPNKETFMKDLKWKEWVGIFVDIKDMWIMNLLDFRKVAWMFIDNYDENLLLETWISVTKKFFNFIEDIQSIFNEYWIEVKTSLWGDEIFIFVEDNSILSKKEIVNIIKSNLINNQLDGRISFNNIWVSPEGSFEKLDVSTSLIKYLEENIEKIYSKNLLKNSNRYFLKKYQKWYFGNIDIKIWKLDMDMWELLNILSYELRRNFNSFEKFLYREDKTNFILTHNPDIYMKIVKTNYWLTFRYWKF